MVASPKAVGDSDCLADEREAWAASPAFVCGSIPSGCHSALDSTSLQLGQRQEFSGNVNARGLKLTPGRKGRRRQQRGNARGEGKGKKGRKVGGRERMKKKRNQVVCGEDGRERRKRGTEGREGGKGREGKKREERKREGRAGRVEGIKKGGKSKGETGEEKEEGERGEGSKKKRGRRSLEQEGQGRTATQKSIIQNILIKPVF